MQTCTISTQKKYLEISKGQQKVLKIASIHNILQTLFFTYIYIFKFCVICHFLKKGPYVIFNVENIEKIMKKMAKYEFYSKLHNVI